MPLVEASIYHNWQTTPLRITLCCPIQVPSVDNTPLPGGVYDPPVGDEVVTGFRPIPQDVDDDDDDDDNALTQESSLTYRYSVFS